MADYHCWPLWWAGDHPPGNIDPTTLPLSPQTIERLLRWADAFDATLNPNDPATSGFTNQQAFEAWEREGLKLWLRLRAELAPAYDVRYKSQ